MEVVIMEQDLFDFSGDVDDIILNRVQNGVTLSTEETSSGHPVKSVIDNISTEIVDSVTSTPLGIVQEVLPENTANAIRDLVGIKSELLLEHGDSISALKKGALKISKVVEKTTRSKVLRTVNERIERNLKRGVNKLTPASIQAQKEQARSGQIENDLNAIFTQIDRRLEEQIHSDNVTNAIRDARADQYFAKNYLLFSRIDLNLERLWQYQDQITQRYQRKSLELQFKQLNAMRDLLGNTMVHNRIYRDQLEAIVKNTGLSDYHKETLTDLALRRTRTRAVDRGLGGIRDYINRIKTNLSYKLLLKRSEYERAINPAVDMLSIVDRVPGMAPGSVLSNTGGLLGGIGGMIGARIRKALYGERDERTGLGEAADRAGLNFRRSLHLRSQEEGILGAASRGILSLFNTGDTERPLDTFINSPDSPAQFDYRTHNTINVQIPGLLAKQLQEITWLRTGEDPGRVKYLYDTGKFHQESEIKSSIDNTLSNVVDLTTVGNRLSSIREILNNNGNFTPDEIDEIVRRAKKSIIESDAKGDLTSSTMLSTLVKDSPELLNKVMGGNMKSDDLMRIWELLSVNLDTGNSIVNTVNTLVDIYGDEELIRMGVIRRTARGHLLSSEYISKLLDAKIDERRTKVRGGIGDVDTPDVTEGPVSPDDPRSPSGGSGGVKSAIQMDGVSSEDMDGDGIEDGSYRDILKRREKQLRDKTKQSMQKAQSAISPGDGVIKNSLYELAGGPLRLAGGVMSLVGGTLSAISNVLSMIVSLGGAGIKVLGKLGIGKMLTNIFTKIPGLNKVPGIKSILALLSGAMGKVVTVGSMIPGVSQVGDMLGDFGGGRRKRRNKRKKRSRTSSTTPRRGGGKKAMVAAILAGLGVTLSADASGDDDIPDEEKDVIDSAIDYAAKNLTVPTLLDLDEDDAVLYNEVIDPTMSTAGVISEIGTVTHAVASVGGAAAVYAGSKISKAVKKPREVLTARSKRKLSGYILKYGPPQAHLIADLLPEMLTGKQRFFVSLAFKMARLIPLKSIPSMIKFMVNFVLFAHKHRAIPLALGRGVNWVLKVVWRILKFVAFKILPVIDAATTGWWLGSRVNDYMESNGYSVGVNIYDWLYTDEFSVMDITTQEEAKQKLEIYRTRQERIEKYGPLVPIADTGSKLYDELKGFTVNLPKHAGNVWDYLFTKPKKDRFKDIPISSLATLDRGRNTEHGDDGGYIKPGNYTGGIKPDIGGRYPGREVSLYDSSKYCEYGAKVWTDGLHPLFKRIIWAMARDYFKLTGKYLVINSWYRSTAYQKVLYRRYGAGNAAEPGTSMHEFGLAIDMPSKQIRELDRLGLMKKYGLFRPIPRETWHAEPIGIQFDRYRLRNRKHWNEAGRAMIRAFGRGGGGCRNGKYNLKEIHRIYRAGKTLRWVTKETDGHIRSKSKPDVTAIPSIASSKLKPIVTDKPRDVIPSEVTQAAMAIPGVDPTMKTPIVARKTPTKEAAIAGEETRDPGLLGQATTVRRSPVGLDMDGTNKLLGDQLSHADMRLSVLTEIKTLLEKNTVSQPSAPEPRPQGIPKKKPDLGPLKDNFGLS
jgi:hypothetical protein